LGIHENSNERALLGSMTAMGVQIGSKIPSGWEKHETLGFAIPSQMPLLPMYNGGQRTHF